MIQLNNINKRFRLYDRPVDRVLSWAGLASRHRDFWALRDINLHVSAGRSIGIIGPNGAGKSTLLKIITGTLFPSTGEIKVEGRIAALLELGTGFHPEFTGRQNIWINGQLLGLSAEEIKASEQEIIEFSELGPFIDQPLRTYSSGMTVRLGFSIAAAVNPQVLIVDEALSVGDAHFSQKCIRRIRHYREIGSTILFVSHDPNAVSTLCDEAVLLDQGTIINRGFPAEVLEHYGALLAARGSGNSEMKIHWVNKDREESPAGPRRSGTFQALVTGVRMFNEKGVETEFFQPESKMRLSISVMFFSPIENPTIGFMIKDSLGVDVYGTNTHMQGMELGSFQPGEIYNLNTEFPLPLGDGDYTITVAVHQDRTHLDTCYDWSDRMCLFRVRAATEVKSTGRVRIPSTWSGERQASSSLDISDGLSAVFEHAHDPLGPVTGLPAPFLTGFHSTEWADNTPFRWMGKQGVFVFCPKKTKLLVAVGLPPHNPDLYPIDVSLHRVHYGLIGRYQLNQPYAIMEFDLPEDAIGTHSLFELNVGRVYTEPGEFNFQKQPRELGLSIYGIRTVGPGEETPPWEDMTHSN